METAQATRPDSGPFCVDSRNRCWIVKRRRKLVGSRYHHIRGDSASSEARRQKLVSTPPLIYVMKYMVPSVLALVPLKYESKTKSLFLENRASVSCFVAATCIYWLIVEAMKQTTTFNSKCFRISNVAALACGVVSVVSLVSIFLSYPVSLVIWIPLPLVLACSLFHRGIKGVRDKIYGVLVWARGLDSMEQQASLPV